MSGLIIDREASYSIGREVRFDVELVFWAALGAASLIVWIALQCQKSQDHALRVWKQHAKRFKARFIKPEPSRFGDAPIRLLLRRDGINLTAELSGAGQPKTSATTIRADAPGTDGFELRVYREGPLSALSKAMGFRDIEVGDPSFDETYQVSANNIDLALAWLDPEVRQEIGCCEPYHFSVIRGEVRAERAGAEMSPFQLDKVFDSVVSLAKGSERLLHASRVLAAELGGVISATGDCWEPNGKVLTVLERRGSQVLIDAVRSVEGVLKGGRIWTRIRARALKPPEVELVILGHKEVMPPQSLRSLPVVTFDHDELFNTFTLMARDGAVLKEMLDPEIIQRLLRLKPALLTSDGKEVSVLLVGLVFDPPVIIAAMDLALDLASGLVAVEAKGPYR